ncbi:MAG: hypothetical protein HYW49_03170 [Deltaproteobacteria bacterium]|nr:hypothetical protein [Deltaproteobacteria bacterium]
MKKLQAALTAFAFCGILFWNLTATAHAAFAGDDDPYYTIKNVQIRELNEPAVNGSGFAASRRYSAWDVGPKKPGKGGDGVDIETIVNLGKELWQFIVDNKPVVNIRTDRATALPKGVTRASELEGWMGPTLKTYEMSFENGYGLEVIDFKFRVNYTYNGSYDGQGQYLANVTIIPALVDVAWGYTFNARVAIPSVLNVGTKAAPVAGVEIQLRYSVDTVVKHYEQTYDFFVRGDGHFKEL